MRTECTRNCTFWMLVSRSRSAKSRRSSKRSRTRSSLHASIFRTHRIGKGPKSDGEHTMTEAEGYVAAIICAAGGRLVSRIRMQKIAYLLDQLGTESGFDYQYHHYGPYSRDLDNAILDAIAFGLVEEKHEHRQSDGARYSVFEYKGDEPEACFKSLDDQKATESVKMFSETNVTVLELAATAHWLATVEKVADWKQEITRRKGPKTENGRLAEAQELLKKLNLAPASS